MHNIYRLLDKVLVASGARKLTGPPPGGPIERQLSKYLDKGWIGGNWKSGGKSEKKSNKDTKDGKQKTGKGNNKGKDNKK